MFLDRTARITCALSIIACHAALAQRGRVADSTIASKTLHRDRRVWVYTPADYPRSCQPACDFLLAFDGVDYQRDIPLPAILDSLIAAHRIRPTVAVLVDDGDGAVRLNDLANRRQFIDFLGDELVPWARAHWAISRDPAHAVVTGSSAGGLAALYLGLVRSDLFGNVLAQSAALWRGSEASNSPPYEWLTGQYTSAQRKPLRIFMDVGALETRGALGGSAPSIRDANRRLRDVLTAKGYRLEYTEVPGGQHSPDSWRPRLPIGLVALQ